MASDPDDDWYWRGQAQAAAIFAHRPKKSTKNGKLEIKRKTPRADSPSRFAIGEGFEPSNPGFSRINRFSGGRNKPSSANLPQCFMAAQFLITLRVSEIRNSSLPCHGATELGPNNPVEALCRRLLWLVRSGRAARSANDGDVTPVESLVGYFDALGGLGINVEVGVGALGLNADSVDDH